MRFWTVLIWSFACALFGARMQFIYHAAKETKHVEQHLADERDRSKRAIRQVEVAIEAQAAANARESDLRRDADRARRALNGLSHASNRALFAARSSHEACLVTAAAQRDVLTQCGEKYQALADDAGRHVSDIKTLTESWPK